MKRMLFPLVFLTACSAQTPPETDVVQPPAQEEVVQKVETFPSELSLDYFASMRLEGKDFALGDLLASNANYKRYTITYSSNGLTISGILNVPNGEGPFPLVVLNHGYIDRSVYTNGRGLKREQDYFARNGFAVLHSDYRGHAFSDPSPLPDDTSIYDAGIEYSMDVVNGIKALAQTDLPIDTDNIFMLGHSLGGGVTMNIAVSYPNLVDGVILYAPVHIDAYENFYRWRDMRLEVDNVEKVIGNRESDAAFWDAISALSRIEMLQAPVLLFQGTADTDVPASWAEFLAEELRENDKEMEYVLYEGEKHEFIAKFDDFMQRSKVFIEKHLDQPSSDTLSIYDESRIAKKPFGLFVTPENSPVFPERFTGFHTGIDFEVLDDEDPHSIDVLALCDGTVLYTNWVKGYGGVLVQSCGDTTILYGHLDNDSIPHVRGDDIQRDELIGTLGLGHSTETDNERPHLHLSVHKGTDTELRGYTAQESELSDWVNPLDLLP